jgi:transposase InsO family protein
VEKVKDAIEFIEKHRPIATDYAVAKRVGISESSAGNIKHKYITKPEPREEVVQIKKSYQWLKRNVCWSMDTMMIRFMGKWLYAILLIEESSRMILGIRLCEKKTGRYAGELLLSAIMALGIKPLVVKHDRGSEFENEDFQDTLKREEIVSLPSPGYYPSFNSIAERTIRIVRRYTMPLETRYDATLEEVDHALKHAQADTNYQFPREMFDGKTSYEMYEAGQDYQSDERERLLEAVCENQEIEDGKYFLSGKVLDKLRRDLVEYLCHRNLCSVWYRPRQERRKVMALKASWRSGATA